MTPVLLVAATFAVCIVAGWRLNDPPSYEGHTTVGARLVTGVLMGIAVGMPASLAVLFVYATFTGPLG